MTPQTIRELRAHLQLTQEGFASILGVSFATVNRWENGKNVPADDYAYVLQTLQYLTRRNAPGPAPDWKRIGALSTLAAVAGLSPLLTLGAALAPVLIAHLPSRADVPLGKAAPGSPRPKPQDQDTTGRKKRLARKLAPSAARKARGKAKDSDAGALETPYTDT
jgi:transcriptional regulator with XRE-family HTH domain